MSAPSRKAKARKATEESRSPVVQLIGDTRHLLLLFYISSNLGVRLTLIVILFGAGLLLAFLDKWYSGLFLVALIGPVVESGTQLASLYLGKSLGSSVRTVAASRLRIIKKSNSAREEAISFAYLRHTKKRNAGPKLALIVAALLFFGVSIGIHDPSLQALSFFTAGTWILITLKEMAIEYRIGCGYFGTNQTEAREILRFIVDRSEDIDFNDSNGKPRCALEPERRSENTRQSIPSGRGVSV